MREMLHSGTACLAMLALASTVAFAADSDRADDGAGKAADSKELSRPPLSHVEYPSDRPAWLDDSPNLESEPHTWVVVTEPAETLEKCREELALMRHAAVASYVKFRSRSDRFDFYPINDKWIEQRLVSRTYQGTVTKGGTQHFELAAELTFEPDVQSEIVSAWTQINVRDRLGALGVLVFVGLTILICASAFLCLLSRRATRQDSVALTA
jgi:hypothetical protein